MAFFANTGPDANARLSQMLGQSLGQGVSRNFTPPEQLANERRLSQAFKNLPENASLEDLYKQAGPTLASTPGGMELLDRYSTLAKQRAINQAHEDIRKKNPVVQEPRKSLEPGEPQKPTKFSDIQQTERYKVPYASNEPTFPEPVSNLKETPLPTINEMDRWRQEFNDNLRANNMPPDNMQADAYARNRMNEILEQNRAVRDDKENINRQTVERVNNALQNAEQSSILGDPNDPLYPTNQRVFKYILTKNKNAPSEVDLFNQSLLEYNNYQNSVDSLTNFYDNPGFFTKLYRQMNGTYKDKAQALQDIQPQLEYFKQNGLFDEARDILVNKMNLGPEDTETAIFPPTETQINDANKFTGMKQPFLSPAITSKIEKLQHLPEMPKQDYSKFVDELGNYLKSHPEANLLALRGQLMENKNIAWTDINKAFTQLSREGKFKISDPIQGYQLNVLRAAPVPSLAKILQFNWSDTK